MIESVKTMVKYTLCLLACALLMSFPAYAQKLPDAGGSMIVSAVSHYNEGNIKKASEILKRILSNGVMRFRALFQGNRSRSEIVATFIAVLELCKSRRLSLVGTEDDCTVACSQESADLTVEEPFGSES